MLMSDVGTGLFAIGVAVCVYFFPTIIALHRDVRNKWSAVVVNVLLGWTLIGWVVAMAMAARTVEPVVRDGSSVR